MGQDATVALSVKGLERAVAEGVEVKGVEVKVVDVKVVDVKVVELKGVIGRLRKGGTSVTGET